MLVLTKTALPTEGCCSSNALVHRRATLTHRRSDLTVAQPRAALTRNTSRFLRRGNLCCATTDPRSSMMRSPTVELFARSPWLINGLAESPILEVAQSMSGRAVAEALDRAIAEHGKPSTSP